MDKPDPAVDPTLEWPVDADVERRRLVKDAESRGTDPAGWLHLAEEVSTLHHPSPEDYRIVDRHIVSGFTLEGARAELLDHDSPGATRSVASPNEIRSPGEGPVVL